MSSKQLQVYFAHGKESGPWGSKIQRLAATARQHGAAITSLDYRGMDDPDERVAKLLAAVPAAATRLVLVGSSMGGYVAAAAATKLRPTGVFLLAPAIGIPGFGTVRDPEPAAAATEIVHGWRDEVINPCLVIDYARRHALPLHLLDDGHRLLQKLPVVVELFNAFLARLAGAP